MSDFHPRKIVVPVDFSEPSQQAVDWALRIAEDDSSIHAIHVLLPLSVMEPGVRYGEITDQTRIDKTSKHLRERYADPKYSRVSCHAVVGDPGRKITEFADAQQADLIVVPSHGQSFFKRLMLGSVAERIVRLAHCPVFVFKADPKTP